jgi:biotin carboxyl carrier protein
VQYELEISGRIRRVVVRRANDRFIVDLDGREWLIDARRVDGQTLSLLIHEGGEDEAGKVVAGEATDQWRSFDVSVAPNGAGGQLTVRVGTASIAVLANGRRARRRSDDRPGAGGGPQRLVAPMPGKILRILVAKGDRVKARQPIAVIEAMKMENELRALHDGTVGEVLVGEGQLVDAGMPVALLDAVEDQ